jgi:16S rRNA G1207 methylase RsmC
VGTTTDSTDVLERGRLTYRQHGVGVQLVVGHGVFSAAAVDPGTRFLLRWLATDPRVGAARRVLDLGCGYGPLGLWLAAAEPERQVVAVDRDAVAVECTARGAAVNGLDDRVRALGSLGYDALAGEAPFDLVVSNIPAKVGPAALRHLLGDAWFHLAPGGVMAVVAVARLAEAVGELLGDPAVEVLDRHANRGYATWTWRFRQQPATADPRPGFDRGAYRRGEATFVAGRLRWRAVTSFTLAEFDTLSHGTVALARLLARRPPPGPVAVLGAGQGHTALAARAAAGSATPARLVDRDLLALHTAVANLGGDGVELRHTGRPLGNLRGCRSAIVALPDKQPVSVTAGLLASALAELPEEAPVLLHGRASDVSRVLDVLARRGSPLELTERESRAGHAAVRARLVVTPPA